MGSEEQGGRMGEAGKREREEEGRERRTETDRWWDGQMDR